MKLYEDETGFQTLLLHQSDMGDLRMCPEQARLKLIGEYFDPDSDVAAIGTRTHSFIEFCLHHRQDTGEWPDATQLMSQLQIETDQLSEDWDNVWRHNHMVEDLGKAQYELQGCCVRWYNSILPQIDTRNVARWEIEKRFDVVVSETSRSQVRVRGSIDFYDGAGTIWDWKTGRFDKRDGWKKNRYDIQAPLYTWAKAQELSAPALNFNFGYMPRGGDDTLVWDMVLSAPKWGMMLAEVESWARTILALGANQPWPLGPDDWHCSPRWCSQFARGLCRGEHEESFWPGEENNVVELKRKVDAGLLPAPKEHHPDE